MTAGAHDAGGGFGRSAGVNTARGLAVIAIAVIVGLLLMREGLAERTEAADSTDTTVAVEDNADDNLVTDPTDDAAADEEEVVETTTTTEAPLVARPAAEVTVLVLNGTNGIQGVAGRGTAVITDAGYVGADPKNADVDGPSVVLYVEGYEADARAVAAAFGVDPDAVVAAFDPATSPIADTQGANVIVRVGNDGVIQV